ncbi:hypothetical protein CR513_25988, partial [Mucuna pruriens]
MPWPALLEKDQECFRQKRRTSSIQRRGHGTQEDIAKRQIPEGEWAPNYEGPYIVKRAFSRGALILIDAKGRDLKHPVNADLVKNHSSCTPVSFLHTLEADTTSNPLGRLYAESISASSTSTPHVGSAHSTSAGPMSSLPGPTSSRTPLADSVSNP